jgi:hypothetical protein
LLAKPTPRNINFGSDRFAMFNKQAGHPAKRQQRDLTPVLHRPVEPAINTDRKFWASGFVAMCQSTKSLRDSPLRG